MILKIWAGLDAWGSQSCDTLLVDLPPTGKCSVVENQQKPEASMKFAISLTAIVIVGGLAYAMWPVSQKTAQTTPIESTAGGGLVEVLLPDTLSPNAQIGKLAFDAKCAVCHGANAAGQDGTAPPLVHKIYEPNHHGDESFQVAASHGVRAHHWPFGNMPPVEGITRGDVTMIIAYVRTLQRANGIH
ncbi:MAG: mono/diheme cytochrome c family protein [Celeribacter sp.]|jgi:mono/diheme cytochrome c family protein